MAARSIFSSSLIVVGYSYGHIYHVIENWSLGGPASGQHGFLATLFTLFLASLVILLRLRKVPQGWPTSVLNIVGAVALLIQVGSVPFGKPELGLVNPSAKLPDTLPGQPAHEDLPDIYYIILDGYGRQDILSLLYGFDNSDFITWLRSQGLYVASQSHANYLFTTLSLTASLNMQYIGDLHNAYGVAFDESSVDQLIHHSTVRAWMEDIGYQTVAFDTGYGPTSIDDVDIYVASRGFEEGPLDIFLQPRVAKLEGILLDTSIFTVIQDFQVEHGNPGIYEATYSEHRERIRTRIRHLAGYTRMARSTFRVCARDRAPTRPLCSDRAGNP